MFKKLVSSITKLGNISKKESSLTHMNVDALASKDNYSKDQLQQTKDVPGTPFHVIKFQNHGWIICCGNLRDDTEYKTSEEAIQVVKQRTWKHIALLIEVITNHAIKNKNG